MSTPNAASNPQQADQQIVSYLQAHPQINAVMTLNNAIAGALVTALGSGSKTKIGTFDLNSTVVTDLQNGSLDFAIDQQQYLQGYLPIVTLYLYLKAHGNSVSPWPGPGHRAAHREQGERLHRRGRHQRR